MFQDVHVYLLCNTDTQSESIVISNSFQSTNLNRYITIAIGNWDLTCKREVYFLCSVFNGIM